MTTATAVLRALRLRTNRLIRQMDRERVQMATNLAIAQQAEDQIRAALSAAGYERMVAEAFADLPHLTAYTGVPQAFTESNVLSPEVEGAIERAVLDAVNLGELSEFTARMVNTLQQILAQDKGELGEFVEELEATLLDTAAQAKTIYETAMHELGQATIALKADASPEKKFFYSGPIDMRLRPFCLARVGRVFTRAEIDAMDNGQLDNTFLTRGGYNCRHLWRPVSALGEYAETASGEYAEAREKEAVKEVESALKDRREGWRPLCAPDSLLRPVKQSRCSLLFCAATPPERFQPVARRLLSVARPVWRPDRARLPVR